MIKNISVLIAFLAALSAHAEDGVYAKKIIIGMSNALSGPAADLGNGVKKGATALFNKINKSGGINGRKIELISLDDQYDPSKAVANTIKLINDKAFVLFGYVGTPTSQAVLPLVGKNDIPYIAPVTGAESLRNPVIKNVFNVRASYFDETEALIKYFVKDLGLKKIGVFVQDDGYGAAGQAGVQRALKKYNLSMVGRGIYKRNTTDVDAGLEDLKKANPDAIVMVGTYKACAAFVKRAKTAGLNSKFANVSFVGTTAFIKDAGREAEGVVISQVFPSPFNNKTPLVKEYQAHMKAAGSKVFDYTSLEGYAGAKVLVQALKNSGKNLTRAAIRASLEKLDLNIGGMTVKFSPNNHSGSSNVYLTIVKNGKPVQFGSHN